MRITLLSNYDLASKLAINYLWPVLQDYQTTIFYTQKLTHKKSSPKALIELAEFERRQVNESSSLISFEAMTAERLNAINTGADFERYQKTQPDLVISIRHMSILKNAVISTPPLGVLNLHSGILPAYQGVMATFWAMLNGEHEAGTSLHFIEDANIDTGSVICRTYNKIEFDKSYLWNVLNLYRAGCNSVLEAIEKINSGLSLDAQTQVGIGRYFSFPIEADLAQANFNLFSAEDCAEAFLRT